MTLEEPSRCTACDEKREQSLATRVLASTVAVFVVTTIHHGYGAYHYHTPWRLHAAAISGAATLLMAGLLILFRSRSVIIHSLARCGFMVLALIVPFLAFGVFEGGYNHALKDLLYLLNASPKLTLRMFPPKLYELPNDAFFEVTGVLQIVPGVLTGYYLLDIVRHIRRTRAGEFGWPIHLEESE